MLIVPAWLGSDIVMTADPLSSTGMLMGCGRVVPMGRRPGLVSVLSYRRTQHPGRTDRGLQWDDE